MQVQSVYSYPFDDYLAINKTSSWRQNKQPHILSKLQNQSKVLSMPKEISSISQLLQFIRTTNRWLFHLGPIYDGTIMINMHDFMPTFEMIACQDPYMGAFPFVKVPESFKKAHTECIVGTNCQNDLLKDPEVIAYMKSKDPNPGVVVMLMDQETEQLCKKNGLIIWGASAQIFQFIGNKVKIIDLLTNANIPFIPNIRSKINSYEHLMSLASNFNSKTICIQAQQGCGGEGTYRIQNENDYRAYQKDLQNGKQFKIMEHKRLKSFTIDLVITKHGTIVGPLLIDMIGHKELLHLWAGYCGNIISKSYFEDAEVEKKVREQIFQYTVQFGNFLYQQNLYKGFLGFDFTVDVDTNEVYFQEVNPRLTGTMGIQLQVYEAQGHQFPIYLYHCLDYLDADLNMNISELNQEWISLRHYQKYEFSHLIIRPLNLNEENLPYDFPGGFWKQEEGVWKHTGKINFRINDLEEGEVFYAPNRGISKGNLIFRGSCQNYDFSLNERAIKLLETFNNIRLKVHA